MKVVLARLDLGTTTVVDDGKPSDDELMGSAFTQAIGGNEL